MLEITTFGSVDVRIDGGPAGEARTATFLRQRKPLAVLLYLAFSGRSRLSRTHLCEIFWPDAAETKARNALSKTLGRIRLAAGDELLLADAYDVSIPPNAVRSDVERFEAAAAHDDPERALGLYRGDFARDLSLPDLPGFESWLDGMRTRFRRQAVSVARAHASDLAARGDHAAAVATLERASQWHPYDESLARDLIGALASTGDVARGIAEYDRLDRLLVTELGTRPGPETRALVARVRSRRPLTDSHVSRDGAASHSTQTPRSDWPRAIAVLPLANLSGDAAQDYFADGITEALITELARRSEYRVISRQSVLGFRNSKATLLEIARVLDVDAVIEGSVSRHGDRVRVTAQLVRIDPESHLWAGTFDRTICDVLALQADVAAAIVTEIANSAAIGASAHRATTQRSDNGPGSDSIDGAEHGATRTVDPLAYEAYLKGRHFSLRPPQMERALVEYHIAIERDPQYAAAWLGLAAAFTNLTLFAYLSPADAFPPLKNALDQALRLDPNMDDALAIRGLYRMLADRDWTSARADLSKGLDRCPRNADTRLALALFLAAMGEFDAAIVHADAAIALDPLAPQPRFTRAWALYRARRFEASLTDLQAILELHRDFALAWPYIAINRALLGRSRAACEAAQCGIRELPDDHEALALGAAALAMGGDADSARVAFEQLLQIGSRRYLDPWAVGVACTGLGELDDAARWFRRMYDERSPSAFCVAHDPLLDPIRAHPTFRDILRRLAFPAVPAGHKQFGPNPGGR